MKNMFVTAGTWWKSDNGNSHNVMLQYDAAKENPGAGGLMGQPLWLKYGGKFKLPGCDLETKATLGERLVQTDKLTWKVTDNIKFGATASYDWIDVLTAGEKATMTMGTNIEMSL